MNSIVGRGAGRLRQRVRTERIVLSERVRHHLEGAGIGLAILLGLIVLMALGSVFPG
ncbi:hypothetical protein [Gluconacetobacter takamatsuzukensis]|uniref:Uncharacterized protein n=1 Tax=Gluconacetobacter takamatsuzukensis TaxID=1286190 RepID=A0A7W4PQB6_9PROT|nr:hypothetical protein [Gluconacetobacter takamatsuzukensis]MBB2206183.1 hypothetical protein [Gluconacetobacter takamatsuzukensis]